MPLYDSRSCAVFSDVSNQSLAALSTRFQELKIRLLSDLLVKSVEAIYQACKFPDHPEVQREILEKSSSRLLGRIVNQNSALVRCDWEEIKVEVMEWCLRLKVAQNFRRMREIFRDIGPAEIVFQSGGDTYWGTKRANGARLTGENVLGGLLTRIKDECLADDNLGLLDNPMRVVRPPEVPDFLFLGEPVSTWKPGKPVEI